MFIVSFKKMGPEERSLVYTTYGFLSSGLSETRAAYTLEEMCGLNLLMQPLKNIKLGEIRIGNERPTHPLIPRSVWNKK